MTAESLHPGEVLLTCTTEGCGRRVVVRPSSMVVLDRGEVAPATPAPRPRRGCSSPSDDRSRSRTEAPPRHA